MILVPATVHGRVLIDNDEGAAVSRVLVGFHGYGQSAEDMIEELRRIPGADQWTRVSIQALNRFYTRGDAKVVANWMTREDREQAIADNIGYVDAVLDRVARAKAHALQTEGTEVPGRGGSEVPGAGGSEVPGTGGSEVPGRGGSEVPGAGGSEVPGFSPGQLARAEAHALRAGRTFVFAGFSQGVAMAYRAALLGARPVAGIIALAGDIPPELKTDVALRHPWPKVLIGVGHLEQWYSSDKVDQDEAFLTARGVEHSVVRFKGGHEWTEEFRNSAGSFLGAVT